MSESPVRKRNARYWLERRANRRTGYPMATLAYYGPDDKRASKVVVGIVTTANAEPSELRKWYSDTHDLRSDPIVAEEILTFLEERRVERIVTLDRLLGCPHEEGIDYPEGETCPECPFWADLDRWTGQRRT